MKTFRQYLKESVITEGVSDLPSDLRNLINKNYSMSEFTKDIYDASHKDLNELVMSDNNIRSGKKISASDIDKITRDGIYLVVDLGSDGMLLAGRGMFNYVFDDKRRYSTVSVNNRNYDIDSPRNIATVLNTDQFKDAKYWLIDLSNAKSTEDLRKERAEAQRGIVQRYNDTWYGTTDKSGYKVDRRKYDEMLQKLKIEGNDYVNQLAEISSRFFKAMANPNAKKHNWDVEKAIDAIKTATNYSVNNYYKPSEVKEKIKKADDAVKVIENYAKVNESVNNTHKTFKQYLTEGVMTFKVSPTKNSYGDTVYYVSQIKLDNGSIWNNYPKLLFGPDNKYEDKSSVKRAIDRYMEGRGEYKILGI